MTKVTILGQEPKKKKELKPIEFVKFANTTDEVYFTPSQFENITLIDGVNIDGFDLMMCWDND